MLFLLTILLVASSTPVFAESEETVYKEEALLEYNETVDFISRLELYSFSDKKPEEIVTRAMFAKMVSDLLGVEGDYLSTDYFTDVSAESEYSASIGAMASLGIMNGVGNGKFLPDEPITYRQAIKTVVSALGYEPAASAGGGYSDGYLHSARLLGIMKKAPYDYDAPLAFETAAYLIESSLEVDVFEILYLTENNAYYASREGRTVLSVYHNIFTDEGIMTDNAVTAINSGTLLSENCVKIGSRVLNSADEKEQEFLGYYVEYYYREDDSALLYVSEKPGRNDVVTVKASDIAADDSQLSKTCLVAEVDGKKKKYKIDLYANLIYNGGVDMTFGKETLKIKDGFIRLIDADTDGDYETIIVEEYSDIVFKSCNEENKKITATYSTEDYAFINYSDYKCVVFQNSDGTEIAPGDIKEGSVVSVFRSKNKEKIRFVVSEDKKELVAESVETDADGKTRIINNDTYYDFSSTYETLMTTKPGLYTRPEASSSYQAFFNYEGNISMLLKTEGRLQYAYIMAAGKEKNTGLSTNNVSVKLHLESDDTAVVPVAKKLTFDGVKNRTGSDILSSNALFASDGTFKPQLVMVRINSEGELAELDIAQDHTGSMFGFKLNEFSLDYVSTSAYSSKQINGLRTYDGNQIIDSNTKIFSVRNYSKSVETTEDDSVSVIDYSEFRQRYGSCYVKFYDVDESWSASVIVVSEPLDVSARWFVVTEAFMQKDADGEYRQAINGWWAQDYRSFIESREGVLSEAVKSRYPDSDGKIKPGDIFQIGFDLDQKIIRARMIYSPLRDTDPDYCFFDMNGNSEINDDKTYFILGYPCYVSKDRISTYSKANNDYTTVSGSDTTTKETFWTTILPAESGALTVFEFNCETKEVKIITREEIPSGAQLTEEGYENFNTDTKLLMMRESGTVNDMMVITNLDSNYN